MPKRKKQKQRVKKRKYAAKSTRTKHVGNRWPLVLIVIGIIFMGTWGIHRIFYARSIQLPDSILALYTKQGVSRKLPVFIDIDGIGRLPIDQAGKLNGVWTIAEDAANHVAQSALPGSDGNIIIYGHNTPNVFGKLREKKIGDYITLTSADGKFHQYRIFQIDVVTPDRVDLLRPTTGETLTVYTCTGFLDSKRLVLRALPVSSK